MEWNLNKLEVLFKKLEEDKTLATTDDVFWVFDKLHHPESDEYKYFERLVAA